MHSPIRPSSDPSLASSSQGQRSPLCASCFATLARHAWRNQAWRHRDVLRHLHYGSWCEFACSSPRQWNGCQSCTTSRDQPAKPIFFSTFVSMFFRASVIINEICYKTRHLKNSHIVCWRNRWKRVRRRFRTVQCRDRACSRDHHKSDRSTWRHRSRRKLRGARASWSHCAKCKCAVRMAECQLVWLRSRQIKLLTLMVVGNEMDFLSNLVWKSHFENMKRNESHAFVLLFVHKTTMNLLISDKCPYTANSCLQEVINIISKL